MDALDFMERESAETLRELMRDYTASFERVAKVATALVGGAYHILAMDSSGNVTGWGQRLWRRLFSRHGAWTQPFPRLADRR